MSRPLRIDYPEAWHHVMNRARQGYDLYKRLGDYRFFVDLLIETAELFNVRVAAYCLMPTHYHLLVQTPEANLSRFMRHINGVYTQRYNSRYNLDGSLFRGRYKSVLVDADNYLLQLVRYIHNNPLKAGLVKRADLYPWSSHKGYLSKDKRWCWLYKDFVLAMLCPQPDARVAAFREFMAENEEEKLLAFFNHPIVPSILGELPFTTWIKEQFAEMKIDKQVPASRCLAPDKDVITARVCRFYEVDPEELQHVRRGRENEPRDVLIYLLRTMRAEPLVRIGKFFNLNNYSSVSSAVQRIKRRLTHDQKLQKCVQQLQFSLGKGQSET